MALGEDLDQIEKAIKQLQIEWEKFFGGVERKPPNDLKARVEALIRRYASAEIRNNTERFRYQNLTARYNTFNEMWGKRLRALEEGRVMGVHGPHANGAARAAPRRARRGAGRRGRRRGPHPGPRAGQRGGALALRPVPRGAAEDGRVGGREVRGLPQADRPAGRAAS